MTVKEAKNAAAAAIIESNQLAYSMLKDLKNDPAWLESEEGKETLQKNSRILLKSKGVAKLGEVIEQEYGDFKKSLKVQISQEDEMSGDDKTEDKGLSRKRKKPDDMATENEEQPEKKQDDQDMKIKKKPKKDKSSSASRHKRKTMSKE